MGSPKEPPIQNRGLLLLAVVVRGERVGRGGRCGDETRGEQQQQQAWQASSSARGAISDVTASLLLLLLLLPSTPTRAVHAVHHRTARRESPQRKVACSLALATEPRRAMRLRGVVGRAGAVAGRELRRSGAGGVRWHPAWRECVRAASSTPPPSTPTPTPTPPPHPTPTITESERDRHRRVADETHRLFEAAEDKAELRALQLTAISWSSVQRALAGNLVISGLKFVIFVQTGSSAMLAEALHSLIDSGNQGLLLRGLYDASRTPDKLHPMGYGKAGFFWALVSALSMFWTGFGASVTHAANQLYNPPELFMVSREMLLVLSASFLLDGYVLGRTLYELRSTVPKGQSVLGYLASGEVRDPFVLAVLYEDAAACTGVVIAASGIALTHYTGDVSYDTLACFAIGFLLGGVALRLVRLNQRFLLGASVDDAIVNDIRGMLKKRPAINAVYDVQTQWLSPTAFSFKAEVDFDGYILSQRLENDYLPRFREATTAVAAAVAAGDGAAHASAAGAAAATSSDDTLRMLMHFFAEDVTRLIELEVKDCEMAIRAKYPSCAFIELEPDSRKSFVRKSDGRAWTFALKEGARGEMLARITKDLDNVQRHLQRKLSERPVGPGGPGGDGSSSSRSS